jgi:hypothetical protein
MQHTVRKGIVDWTGDNPFIYLKRDAADTNWSSLSLYFRVAVSPHGAGKAIVVIEDPYDPAATRATRLCLTDNELLARYLLNGFVKKFALFRPGIAVIDAMEVIGGASFETRAGADGSHVESANHPERNLRVAMTWEGLGRAFAVDVPRADTQTGRHEMLSIFQPATSARVVVGDRRLAGDTVERDFFGGRAQSAALAFSETWLLREDAE